MTEFWAAFGGGAAAGVFTLSAVLLSEYIRHRRDRERVAVDATAGIIDQPGEGASDPMLFLAASNPHTRPTILEAFGYRYRKKKWGYVQINPQLGFELPRKLEPGDSYSQWTPIAGIAKSLREQGRTPRDIKDIWFRLRTGRTFGGKIPKYAFRQINEEYLKSESDITRTGQDENENDADDSKVAATAEVLLESFRPVWIGITAPVLTGVLIGGIQLAVFDGVRATDLTFAGLTWDVVGFLLLSTRLFRTNNDLSHQERILSLVFARYGFGFVVGGIFLQIAGSLLS